VEATPEHPFFVEENGFIAAKKLARSDLLVDSHGRRRAVVSVTSRCGEFPVYNFEVEGTHTYFAAGLWVHNQCDPFHHIFPQNKKMARYFARAGIDVHDFTVQLPQEYHDILHWPGWWREGGAWNQEWQAFMDANPVPDFMKIWNKADEMIKRFGLENLDFVRYPRH
jgi:uncharacterized lipoprotein (TIGR02269 family)